MIPRRVAVFCFAASLAGLVRGQQPLPPPPKPAAVDAFPLKAVPAFGGVVFREPVDVVFAPGDPTRAFVVEREGRIAWVREGDRPRREIFLDLSSRIGTSRTDQGLLSVAFHPRFAENGFLYAWYCIYLGGRTRALRLARFKVSPGNADTAELASEFPLITQPVARFGHDGCRLLFGPDGYLYISVGDGDERVPEIHASIQHIDRDFFGGILRIDVDRRPGNPEPHPHSAVHAGTYAVPQDNPFVGATSFNGEPVDPRRVRTEFWAVGLRNPWRMGFDVTTGALWTADLGEFAREEVDLIVPGGNYGWDYREGLVAGPHAGPPPGAKFIEPLWDYGRLTGVSITGGFVYRGSRLPSLDGKYLFADFALGQVWALAPDGPRSVTRERVVQVTQAPGVVSFTPDPRNGDPLLASFTTGKILRLVPNGEWHGPPARETSSGK